MANKVCTLKKGDQFLFEGPEGSAWLTIETIEIEDDYALIVDSEGDYLECFIDDIC